MILNPPCAPHSEHWPITLCRIQDHVAEAKPPAEAKATRASADTSRLQEFFQVGGQVMVHQGYSAKAAAHQKYTGLLGSWLAQSLRLPLPRAQARWLDGSGGCHFPHQVPLWSWTLSQLHV